MFLWLCKAWHVTSHQLLHYNIGLHIKFNSAINSTMHKVPYSGQNSMGHYYVQMNLPVVPVLSHIHPDCIVVSCFLRSILILSSHMCKSSKWSLSFSFSDKNFVCDSHLSDICHMPCLSHLCWCDCCHNVPWRVHILKLLICVCSS
jgi:hypothetical protein